MLMQRAPGQPVRDEALITDLYQLTMAQAYWQEGMTETAVFELFCRHLPQPRNYLVTCGLEDALDYLEELHFSDAELAYLESLGRFTPGFLDYLSALRFEGTVRAMPEGTVAFANEPLLEVVAPLPQAQLAETYILNQVHYQTLVASKAARVVSAARGRTVVDFGLRRYHGVDAGLKAARAAYIAGVGATSNVQAGHRYGIPVSGTMAHSYVLAHDDELAAFRAFARLYPDTVLLVDTYDTLEGVEQVIRLARELGSDFHVRAIRIDSGDLAALAAQARKRLYEAGLANVGVFVSGDLDEYRIAELVAADAPINGFGVGTRLGTSADAPFLNSAYKLVEYGGRPRMKLSTGKLTLPGRKQVFRVLENGRGVRDVVGLHDESVAGRPLLRTVMRDGERLPGASPLLAEVRSYCAEELGTLPEDLRSLAPVSTPYPVEVSFGLAAERDHALRLLEEGGSTP
jgi:nicotinate phosphoribosyltransferase